MSENPLIQIESLSKRYGATQALSNITLDIYEGEVLGLLGANGAGKSTLIKILSGLQSPTSGRILVNGNEGVFEDAASARRNGIITVHQNIDDGVVFGTTVAENLILDRLAERGSALFVTQRRIRSAAAEMLAKQELDLPLDLRVDDLSASERQQVSIARALAQNPKLLILDEPTSTLSADEIHLLFDAVRAMRRQGITVLYVSHRMGEIEDLCDRAVVLRDGIVRSQHQAPLDLQAITASILGSTAYATSESIERRAGREVIFRGQDLRVSREAKPLNVEFRRGEVVGITGLVGAGKTELLEQISGVSRLVSGSMYLDGSSYKPNSSSDAIRHGVVMMPEERAAQAIFPGESIAWHGSIARLSKISTAGFLRFRAEKQFAKGIIKHFNVKARGVDAPMESLSGGNQQKALVGRWLSEDHRLVILDEPFRGVDLGARAAISTAVREYAHGSAVVLASSDPEEVMEVVDRILVMLDGQLISDIDIDKLTVDSLAELMATTHKASKEGAQ